MPTRKQVRASLARSASQRMLRWLLASGVNKQAARRAAAIKARRVYRGFDTGHVLGRTPIVPRNTVNGRIPPILQG